MTVSIHAPVKERLRGGGMHWEQDSFNSRSRKGATSVLAEQVRSSNVSIHAPVRERRQGAYRRTDTGCFNSRSRKGATKDTQL